MDELKKKILNNPELQHLRKIFDEENPENQNTLAMLLDEPKLLDALIDMASVYRRHGLLQDQNNTEQELDENDPQIQLKKAMQINEEWFNTNLPLNRTKQTRKRFNSESAKRNSISELVHKVVKTEHALSLTQEICNEIELHVLSLNTDTINILHIDYDTFNKYVVSELNQDINFVVNNFLDKSEMNITNCILTPFFTKELFINHSNIINCNKQHLYENKNKKLNGNGKIKCGDIIHIEGGAPCLIFQHIWYIIDTDNITMQRIGITARRQYIHDPHIIIPGFVTQYLLDPIKAYSTLIHQHCWEDGGCTLEIELQIAPKHILFSVGNKLFLHHMDRKNELELVAQWGWKQKIWKDNRYKYNINDIEINPYYTIYVKTDAGMCSPLVGICNHPNILKVNLSQIAHRNANGKYVIEYKNIAENKKILKEKQVDEILLKLDGNIGIKKVSKCLKRGIAFGVVVIDENKGLDTILIDGNCMYCERQLSCSIRDVLYQPDYAGYDYCECENGAAVCDGDGCYRSYVTGMCNGNIKFDSGKFHNHCKQCPDMGKCIYDYRNTHCYGCGDHYFCGSSGRFGCHNCDKNSNDVDF
eukprot:312695_1